MKTPQSILKSPRFSTEEPLRRLPINRTLVHRAAVRVRLDQVLVDRGLCESREKAKRAVMAGQVRVNGHPAGKASDPIKESDIVELDGGEKFVSRGGHKLEHALVHFKKSRWSH